MHRILSAGVDQLEEEYSDMSFELELAMIGEMQTLENSLTATGNSYPGDEFLLEDADIEAFSSLGDGNMEQSAEQEQPPSSVVQALDVESNFAEDYDPNLQFSSPHTDKSRSTVRSSTTIPSTESIDWDNIREQISTPNGDTIDRSNIKNGPTHNAPLNIRDEKLPPTPTPSASAPRLWPSWTPAPMNISIFNPSRTCFRLGELIESKAAMIRHQPHAVFNVFARVLYSSRENFFRRQYFQLRDLFTELPPYLTGALLG